MKLYKHFEIVNKIIYDKNDIEIECVDKLCFRIDKKNCTMFLDYLEPGSLICILTNQCSQGQTFELHIKLLTKNHADGIQEVYNKLKPNNYGEVALGFIKMWERNK